MSQIGINNFDNIKRFESYNSLVKHKKRLHTINKMKLNCSECNKVQMIIAQPKFLILLKAYSDSKALQAHIESIHKKSEELHCGLCCWIFSSKYALNRHTNEVHRKIVQHTCSMCNKKFSQFSNLKIHMRIHTGLKPFKCEHDPGLCNVAFTTKQCLQVIKSEVLIQHDGCKLSSTRSNSNSCPNLNTIHFRFIIEKFIITQTPVCQ